MGKAGAGGGREANHQPCEGHIAAMADERFSKRLRGPVMCAYLYLKQPVVLSQA